MIRILSALFCLVCCLSLCKGQDNPYFLKAYNYFQAQDFKTAADEFSKSWEFEQDKGNDSLVYLNRYYIALSQYYQGLLNDAFNNFLAIHKYYLQKEDPVFISFSHSNLALVYYAGGMADSSVYHYEQALDFAEKSGDNNQMVMCSYNLASAYQNFNYIQKAIEAYIMCRSKSKIAGQENYYSTASYNAGQLYNVLGDTKKAIEFILESAKSDEERKDFSNAAAKLNNIGMILSSANQNEEAISYFLSALSKLDTTAYPDDLSSIYYNIGASYDSLNDSDKTIHYYYLSMQVDKRMGNDSLTASKLNNIGIAYYNRENYDSAAQYFREASLFFSKLNHKDEQAINLMNLGNAYISLHLPKPAINAYTEALSTGYQFSDFERMNLLNNVGKQYYFIGQFDSALVYYNRALDFAKDKDLKEMVAVVTDHKGLVYFKLANYDSALYFEQMALEIDVENNITDHISIVLSNIGLIHNSLGDFSKSLEFYTKALNHDEKYEIEEYLPTRYNNLGLVYYAWGDLENARMQYNKALDKAVETNRINDLSVYYTNLGLVCEKQGKYEQGLAYFQKAVKLDSLENNMPRLAANLNNIGMIHNNYGEYDIALSFYERALALSDSMELLTDKSVALSNIGYVYNSWGVYEKALYYYNESVKIDRKTGSEAMVARKYNNIGGVYFLLEDFEKARKYYLAALELDLQNEKKADLAEDYNNLGTLESNCSNFDKAEEYILKSIDISKELDLKADYAMALSNMSTLYTYLEKYDAAIKAISESAKMLTEMGRIEDAASAYENLGMLYYYNDEPGKAIDLYKKAIAIYENVRTTMPAQLQKEYMEKILYAYRYLSLQYLSCDSLQRAYETIEFSRAKELSERLDADLSSIPFDSLYLSISPDECMLSYASAGNDMLSVMVLTQEYMQSYIISKMEIVKQCLIDDRNFEQSLLLVHSEDELRQITNIDDPEKYQNEQFKGYFDELIAYYRKTLIRYDDTQGVLHRTIGEILYQYLLAPVDSMLKNSEEIAIIPDGILGLLPFESLINGDKKYLAETHEIKYLQSLSVYYALKQVKGSKNEKILAIGGAIYNPSSYESDMLALRKTDNNVMKGLSFGGYNPSQIMYLSNKMDNAIATKKSLSDEYRMLGITNWQNLAGSIMEVNKIGEIFPETVQLIGKDATESALYNLSEAEKLKEFNVLHFSVHGISVPDLPKLSALVMTLPVDSLDIANEDGYMRMDEIAKLNIAAEFINLSACETGVGKIYSSEGVVSLVQSFLIAGAGGVSASLWQVADQSTAEFMVEMYRIVKEEDISYSKAISKVKRKFIAGEMNEKWTHPFFWAPFVYYGK